MQITFLIPDTLRNWPWPRSINPHSKICEAEAMARCESWGAFSPESQKAFNRCNFSLLASLAYPCLSQAGLRIACDLMNAFFVIDEYSDAASGEEAQIQADIIMDAIRNPSTPRPRGEWIGGEVLRQFWENAIKTATISTQRRFVKDFQFYVDAVVQQAKDRNQSHIQDITGYFSLRRKTIGAIPSFDILVVEMDLPDIVFENPVVEKLNQLCVDMLLIDNDLVSFNVEQARGDDTHNIIRIVMNQYNFSLTEAMEWISQYRDQTASEFLEKMEQLPSFGHDLDEQLKTYVDGLGNWVRANEAWSFESERYFGKRGLEVQRTRIVDLLPSSIAPQLKQCSGEQAEEPIEQSEELKDLITVSESALLPAATGITISSDRNQWGNDRAIYVPPGSRASGNAPQCADLKNDCSVESGLKAIENETNNDKDEDAAEGEQEAVNEQYGIERVEGPVVENPPDPQTLLVRIAYKVWLPLCACVRAAC